MKPVGELFQLKIPHEILKEELVPSFDSVLEAWLGGPRRTSFADPDYVAEVTYLTPPLKVFIERIVDKLRTFGVVGGPLERGFGFGKTHSLILLWHIFTSNIHEKMGLKLNTDVIRSTLVLGLDFSKEKPFVKLVKELEAYADPGHPVARLKDPNLIRAISEILGKHKKHELYSMSSDDLASLLAEILEKYEKLGGTPRLLLLIDELGWGIAQRLRRYADKRNEKNYNEVNAITNFLSYVYEKLHSKPVGSVVIWVLAEQDRKEINILAMKHQDDKLLYGKVKGTLDDLDNIAQRYSRGLGGTSIAELSYDPEHALEIAKHRILKALDGIELSRIQEEYIRWLESVAEQLNMRETLEKHKEQLKKHYPFSLGLINLMKKLMNPRDTPSTEFVRTVIHVAGEAARKALETDPTGAYTVGVKHLSIPEVVQAKLMGMFEVDWIQAASDIEDALSRVGEDKRNAAEQAAKYILAKGVTANIMIALESRDKAEISKYGSTLDEIQLETIQAFPEEKALKIIESLSEAIEKLCAESARIDEREVEGKRYYLPSLFKTIYNKLAYYIVEERKNLENKAMVPVYIRQTGTIPSLFYNVKVTINGRTNDVTIFLTDYRRVRDAEALTSDPAFQEAQNKGKLLLILVPPWDMELFSELYFSGQSYDAIVTSIANKLQMITEKGKLQRHLHVVVVLPNMSRVKMDRLLDKLAVYEATKSFLEYLSRKEDVINERLQEFEETLVKRRDLLSIIGEEIKARHKRELRNKLEKEIGEARRMAQRELVRLSRELVAEVLELYQKAVYYSLDKNSFTHKDIVSVETVGATDLSSAQYIAMPDPSAYASIVNKFLSEIVKGLAYEYDAMKIMRAVLEAYRRDFEASEPREYDRIDEVVENMLLGTYGVKPLSADVAKEALRYLNGQIIDLADKTVKVILDEPAGLIRFEVETKKKEEPETTEAEPSVESTTPITMSVRAIQAPARLAQVLHTITLELPPGFNVDDVRSRLTVLLNQGKISLIDMRLETESITFNFAFKKPSTESLENYKVAINLMSRLSRDLRKPVTMTLRLLEPISEEDARRVFGEYFGARRGSFDAFLPP